MGGPRADTGLLYASDGMASSD
ncbi:protein of unknown function (plasmid) [Shinella sp. WSC3-e]|nr:hypothetical protein SHINE37_20006 [Rhizobiaceae bacterium]CAK7261726.1 protein of unknown function [Shinella sp. WSC3-e]CAK7262375.1 protein of unknown function [Shinella sp. WSC3-e]